MCLDNLNNLYARYILRVTNRSVERDGLGAKIPPEAWHALLVNGSPRHYRVGEVLVRQGEPGRYVLALTSGSVKVTRVEPDGHELVLAVRGRGEIVGVITYLDSQGRSATVTAISACLAYMVSEVRFRRIVGEFNIGDAILRHVTARLRESDDIRSELASLAPRRRIAKILLRFSVGEDCVLSQWDIAKAVGLSRSAVAGELAWLRLHGLVSTGRGRVTITDLARLNDLADGRAGQLTAAYVHSWTYLNRAVWHRQMWAPLSTAWRFTCLTLPAGCCRHIGAFSPSIPSGSPGTRAPANRT